MRLPLATAGLAALAVVAGCGSNGRPTSKAATTAAAPTRAAVTTNSSGSPNALQAEAGAAAAGDIPDNQVFLAFRNGPSGYSMKYPEGWAQRGRGDSVIFRDKNNIVRIVVGAGAAPTAASVRAGLARLKHVHVRNAPQAMALPGGRAVKAVYTTQSPPNPVTGKRVKLVVDRYYLWKEGRRAVVDLGTPEGVDNVDAYRLMIQSFRWR
jgi:hypothetical protein